jgi:hypothetical protein
MFYLRKITIKTTFLVVVFLLLPSCNESLEQQRLRQYLASINAQESAATPSATPAVGIQATNSTGSTHAIVGGTPREVKEGFCGDGIINGNNEDCDQGAIQNTTCREYGGYGGEVKCQKNCLYDISDCITPAVDKKIGGQAESCKCACSTSSCRGGCRAIGNAIGQSACLFECDNDCTCRCEDKLEAHIENCEFRCACTVDPTGNPACDCSMDQCDLLTTIAKNIATIVSR